MKMSKAKNIFALFLTSVFIFSNLVVTRAAQTKPVRVFLDGKQINYDVQPQIINSRTMVPISLTVQALTGVQATYDEATKSMSFVASNGNFVQHKIGDTKIYVNGTALPEYDTPSVLLSDRTLVPIIMLADATGCKTVWDGVNYFVYLTSPTVTQKEKPAITSIDPNTYTIDDGGTLTVKVTTNSTTAKVKLSTTANVMVAESTQSSVVSNTKIFTITTKNIKTSGKYRIYAGDENSYDNLYYKEIYVTVNAGAKISSVVATNGGTSFPANSPISFTITCSDLTTKVKLVSDTDANEIVETTTFTNGTSTTGNPPRVFTLTWTPKSTGTRVPKFYAGTDQGYSATSSSITLTITQAAPVTVYDATPSSSSVSANHSFTVTVNTSTSATKVWLSVPSYGNSDTYTTNYTDNANGRRTWTLTWSINTVNQNVTVYAYAADANGNQNYVTFNLNIGSSTSTGEIISAISSVSSITYEGQQVTITVQTLTSINYLTLDYAGYSYTPSSGPVNSGTYYTWTFIFNGKLANSYYTLNARRTDNTVATSTHYFNQSSTTGGITLQFNQATVTAGTYVTGTITTPTNATNVRYGTTYDNAYNNASFSTNNGYQMTWTFSLPVNTTTTYYVFATTNTGTLSTTGTITVTNTGTGYINSFNAVQSTTAADSFSFTAITVGTNVNSVRVGNQNNLTNLIYLTSSSTDNYNKTWTNATPTLASNFGITTPGTYTFVAYAYDINGYQLGTQFTATVTYTGSSASTAQLIRIEPAEVSIKYGTTYRFYIYANAATTSIGVQITNDITSVPSTTTFTTQTDGTRVFTYDYTPINVSLSQVYVNFTARNANNVDGSNPTFAKVTLYN